jgi:3D-(3,5/4)-trihydroxycyclohexane-1,2-dione acylhydrolase (decyclizing)
LAESCGAHDRFNQFRFREASSGLLTGESLPIDFAANAASLGAQVICARGRPELERGLEAAKASSRTTVIVVEVDAEVRVPSYESWWDVPVAEISESERVQAVRREYEVQRQRERWFV